MAAAKVPAMATWGYARTSTTAQDPALQVDALTAAGVDDGHLVLDQVSGGRESRPGLDLLWPQLEAGDTLLVWKLDRLGRSTAHLVQLLDDLGRRDVDFRSLTEATMDTTSAQGKLITGIMAAFAAFERDLIRERTIAGLAAARAAGKQLGRPTRIDPHQVHLVWRLHQEKKSQAVIAASTGLTRSTVGRILRGEIVGLRHIRPDDTDEGTLLGEKPAS